MKQLIRNAAFAVILALAASFPFIGRAAGNLLSEAQSTLTRFQQADPTITQYLNSAPGYVVFPDVHKGGLVIGGAHGNGVVFQHGNAIGEATISQASIGAQAGGQTFAQLIVFETQRDLENFKSGNLELGADLSAVAAAEGSAKTARYSHGVAVFVLPNKGLMAQASVGGQKFKFTPWQQQQQQ